ARGGEDQVERQGADVAAGGLDGPRDLVGGVPAVEGGERLGAERLHPDADPVDPERREQGRLLVGQAVRRGFDGELGRGRLVGWDEALRSPTCSPNGWLMVGLRRLGPPYKRLRLLTHV